MLQRYDKQITEATEKAHGFYISYEAPLILHQDASLPSYRAVKGCPCQLVFLLRHRLKVNCHWQIHCVLSNSRPAFQPRQPTAD